MGPIYLGDGIWSTKVDWADYTPQEFEDRRGQFLAQYLKEQHELAVQGLPTTDWSFGLSQSPARWSAVDQITANVLHLFGSAPEIVRPIAA